ncbi:Oidioi.mRNA.OKI2018_I69.chr1.g1952.t1.cds [Oikopleura dioica]|uniref:Oidioi.mRNA.OKI2018_I69.chr1.g1952.t1.cds n=1 Tax=Oikopleura dioica TaxID=34765 RepID=A0ABN7SQ26_OIKDI|nr:Oidioi.mRNA.OKI2018_I69.chr1.g1952.t1.cds [Oikopleura dioica]
MFVQKTLKQNFGISQQLLQRTRSAAQNRDYQREAQKFQTLLNESTDKTNKFPYFRNLTKPKIVPPNTGKFF